MARVLHTFNTDEEHTRSDCAHDFSRRRRKKKNRPRRTEAPLIWQVQEGEARSK